MHIYKISCILRTSFKHISKKWGCMRWQPSVVPLMVFFSFEDFTKCKDLVAF